MSALDGGRPRIAGTPIPPGRYHPTQTRCGICQERLVSGERRAYVDDEPCHRECAEDASR